MGQRLLDLWPYVAAGFTILIAILASGHALLYRRDSRAAILWVGFIWLSPLLGALFYLMFGVNRIRRTAALLRRELPHYQATPSAQPFSPERLENHLPAEAGHLGTMARLMNRLVNRPLLPGNRVEMLLNGDQAFPSMLEAIASAQESITLATYIFDRDAAGERFVHALGVAVARGVEVRVLVDYAGARYSWPTIVPLLRRARVPVARFLPSLVPWRALAINMRNHRKILVVDGRTGFTGGINIRQGSLLKESPRHPVQDIHFKVEGPVAAHLQEAFADDWLFTTREALRGPKWFPSLEQQGEIIARGITDGPDEDFEKLRWTLLGALSCARRSIHVVTPYFLPDQAIISALNVAAMRGVNVNILLPAKSNLPFVQWAMFAVLWQLLERGCRLWLTSPPFDHSKLMVVDGCWSLIGSTNWDPRSLRLNFEFNLECYGAELAAQMEQLIQSKLDQAREITLEEVDSRNLAVRLRDGVARLFTPFL